MTETIEARRKTKAAVAPAGRRPLPVGEIAAGVKAELEAITGLKSETVLGIERVPEGWRVRVVLLELARIPAATDVLASYEALIDADGALLSYHRTRRYFRDQIGDEL